MLRSNSVDVLSKDLLGCLWFNVRLIRYKLYKAVTDNDIPYSREYMYTYFYRKVCTFFKLEVLLLMGRYD